MFYKKRYLAAVAENKELKDAVIEREIAISRLKQNHDALLDENVNLGKIAEDCRKKEEAALMKVGALEGEVSALKEDLARSKKDTTAISQAFEGASKKLADILAHEGDCEGCHYKATKNYRKCNSCTRNPKAVDKYISVIDTNVDGVSIGEVPTPEEAASATNTTELKEAEAVIEIPDVPSEPSKPTIKEAPQGEALGKKNTPTKPKNPKKKKTQKK